MTKDPICGMDVDPAHAKFKSIRKGKEYYFCSEHCKLKFESKRSSVELIAIVLLLLIAGIVFVYDFMLPFMGVVFLLLSGLKLLDIKGFAARFVQYDLIAVKSKVYAITYPFIELVLGLMYVFSFQIKIAAVVTIFVMTIGAIGVGKNIFSKNKVQCACLGAKINVPLTRFTLVEDIVMVIMGVMILIL